jgi:hypothetical protein
MTLPLVPASAPRLARRIRLESYRSGAVAAIPVSGRNKIQAGRNKNQAHRNKNQIQRNKNQIRSNKIQGRPGRNPNRPASEKYIFFSCLDR